MQILVNIGNKGIIVIDISRSRSVFELKKKILQKTNINPHEYGLVYENSILDDSSTLKKYSIHNKSLITAFQTINGGVIQGIHPSAPIGNAYTIVESCLLPKGKLSKRFFPITSSTNAYFQRYSDCYAYAAASAYVNTAMRIYGLESIPSFDECYNLASYDKENGGDEIEAIQRIEAKKKLGIKCEKRKNVTIQEIMNLSVILSFSTSMQGWVNVSKGDLLTFPIGKSEDFHAVLVEGYDFYLDCLICKNSWGNYTSEPRFNFTPSAAHSYEFAVVYFTEQSIQGKIAKEYKPRMKKFIGELDNEEINCAWMNSEAAIYEMDYVCEYHPEKKGDLKYLGYKIDEWIEINLNRKKGQKFPDHYVYNMLKKNELKYLSEIVSNNDLFDRIEKEVEEPRNLIKVQYHKIHNIPLPFPEHKKTDFNLRPHLGGKIKRRIIRNSNITTPYIYQDAPKHAYVAAYAYIDTIYRMYGPKYIPNFEKCLQIASYKGKSEGSARKAIELLEDHFNFGIQYYVTDDLTPSEAMTLSVIAKIKTCKEGLEKINEGKYVEHIEGETNFYSLVKGYDSRSNCFICKNSFNPFDGKPFFDYKCDSSQRNSFIVVYFTIDNIIGKTIKEYRPKMKKFIGILRLKPINCAWMDEKTAKYETGYVIKYYPEKRGKLKYLGYDIDEWIEIMQQSQRILRLARPPSCLII